MSRLTNNNKDNPILKDVGHANCKNICEHEMFCDMCPIQEAIDKLAHYEDLEEQGRLIELPCKVGDTIWAIFPTWTPMECEVVAIEILSSTVNIETKVVDSDADRIFWPADFGKTVFLTKEEAETKLAELKGDDTKYDLQKKNL